MKFLQLIRDFCKWRKEKRRADLELICANEASYENRDKDEIFKYAFASGMLYCIEHRKEILKKVKI